MIKKKYKLIVFDLDGTILTKQGHVCNELKKVVAQLKSKGYLFTIVTARIAQSGLIIAKELGLIDEDIIVLNGGFITNQKHDIIYSKTFPYTQVEKLMKKINHEIVRNYYYQFDWIVSKFTLDIDVEIKFSKVNILPQVGVPPANCNKITLIGENHLLKKAQEILQTDDSLLASFSHENYLEVACKTISKYSGLFYYAKQKLIDMNEIIAFGDGENDIPMLSNGGLGVAMNNALPNVKLVADDIAQNHDDEGVAKYLKKLIEDKVL